MKPWALACAKGLKRFAGALVVSGINDHGGDRIDAVVVVGDDEGSRR